MRIIIAGAGEVGFHLAKQLSNEEHDIIVIDVDNDQLQRVNASCEVLTINGSSTAIKTLKEAKANVADIVVAVTSTESININTALMAKKLGAKSTIARVENAEYTSDKHKNLWTDLGIDYLIYPEELAAFEIVKRIERASATDIIEFENGKLSLLGLKLDKNAPVIKKTLSQTTKEYSDMEFRITAIQRGITTIIPSGNDYFLAGDQIFVITKPENIDKTLSIFGKIDNRIDEVMILGGGKIGRIAAEQLEDKVNLKLIESNKSKTIELADALDKTLVIKGDGRDIDLLAQEGIVDMHAFIAVTDNAETNIITSLMSKHLGVAKNIALVDNVDYIALTQTIGLDSLINKKIITANNIYRFIRRSKIISIASLQGIDAEVFEYIATPKSPITKKSVKDLKIPANAILGGVIRNGKGIITVGDTLIQPDDKVVIFALPGSIKKVEKLFD